MKIIFHIAFSVLVMLSSTGILLNKHICQDELKSVALFSKAENCHSSKKKAKKQCPKHQDAEKMECSPDMEKDCCNNESEYFIADVDFFKVQNEQLDLDQQLFISAFVFSFIEELSLNAEYSPIPHLNYKPPLLLRDIPILKQSFLC